MEEKLSRSISALRGNLAGYHAVVLCAGSGMDAEFLARQGAPTLAVDVSLGSCKRTRARARETGLPILPVVGDAESLPLRDASVELAYVHDGLHHLENYFGGLREMVRVARNAVSISEPTQAVATALSVRVGVSEEVEESGNTVHRIPITTIVDFLQAHGFSPVATQRYAMYYQHQPGRIVRLLSRERLAPASLAAFRTANRLIGPIGNKMSVQAVRLPQN
jgi:ubiquinone/menaquinone biosynthesis C-methylase UbiE